MSVRPDKDEASDVPAGSRFFSMEVVSRVMNFTKSTPCPLGQRYPCTGEPFEWNSQIEIFSVMHRIQEAFSGPGFCLANNKNTGLHIHFGNGEEKPPVRTSLGMFAVFTALERLFDSALNCSRMPLLPHNGHPDCTDQTLCTSMIKTWESLDRFPILCVSPASAHKTQCRDLG
jgi:hypothetical protein